MHVNFLIVVLICYPSLPRLTKLGSLFVKTLAKPFSKRIKHEFSRYNFTKQILIGIGQTTHSVTSRMQIWSAGYKVRSIKPLEEEKAIKDGAEFVGESFIFLVSGALLVWEYNRSAESTRAKEEKKQEEARLERAALQAKLIALDARLKAVENTVKHNSHSILGLVGSTYIEPAAEKLVDIEDDDDKVIETLKSQTTKDAQTDTSSPPNTTGSAPATSDTKPWWKVW